MKRALLTAICLVICSSQILAQLVEETNGSADSTLSEHEAAVSREAEKVFDSLLDETNGSGEAERLLEIYERPYELNTVSRAELETIPGITPAEASEIVTIRKIIRKFTSMRQLAVLEPDGAAVLRKLRPYVTLSENVSGRNRDVPCFVRLTTRLAMSLQKRKGSLEGQFSGSPMKEYSRLTLRGWQAIDCSVAFDKSEGEKISDGFASGYISIEKLIPQTRVVFGDYTIEAGQGLVLWRPSTLAKSVAGGRKSALGVRPYRSSGESNFFRGFGATASIDCGGNDLALTAFLSARSLGASLDSSGNVIAFYKDGLYRTELELSKRDAVDERSLGCQARLSSQEGWEFGATVLHTVLNRSAKPAEAFDFAGRVNDVIGLSGRFSLSRLNLFGEVASTRVGARAGIIGAVCDFGPESALTIIYRSYMPGFQNSRAQGFGEHAETNNEQGLYLGVQLPVGDVLRMSGYIDQFKFPWRTFLNVLPTTGREFRIEAQGKLSQTCELAMAYRNDSRETTESVEDEFSRSTRQITQRYQESVRLTATENVSSRITLTGRIEVTRVHFSQRTKHDQGILLYQSLRYSLGHFSAEARLVSFDTDSFESRVYQYESDLGGVFSNPALSGKGGRWYLLVRYTPARPITFSAKYAETRMEGVKSIGTGLMEIKGDTDNRVALQVDIRP